MERRRWRVALAVQIRRFRSSIGCQPLQKSLAFWSDLPRILRADRNGEYLLMFVARHRSKDIAVIQAFDRGVPFPLQRDDRGRWSISAPSVQELDDGYFNLPLNSGEAKSLLRDAKDVSIAISSWLDLDTEDLNSLTVKELRARLDAFLSKKVGRDWKIVVDANEARRPRRPSLGQSPAKAATLTASPLRRQPRRPDESVLNAGPVNALV